MFSGIRFRIVLFTILLVTAGLLAINFIVTGIVERHLVNKRITEQTSTVQSMAVSVSRPLAFAESETLYRLLLSFSIENDGRALLLNNFGTVIVDAFSEFNGETLKTDEIDAVLFGNKANDYGFHHLTDRNGKTMWTIYYTSAVTYDGEQIGLLFFSSPAQEVADRIAGISRNVWLVTAAVDAAIILLMLLVSGVIMRPIERIKKSVIKLGEGDFSERITIEHDDEFADLAGTINEMSAKLERLDKSRNRFVSDASHELKTPMASMKILAESLLQSDDVSPQMYREFLGDINHEIDRLDKIISDLLTTVKLDADESEFKKEPVDIAKVLREVTAIMMPLAGEKKIDYRTQIQPDVWVDGNELYLHRLFLNLSSNAVKYTNNGGHVLVTMSKEDGKAIVSFQDDGIGMSPETLAHLFERFYRADKARSRATGGTGLGLSICKSIVRLHGGDIAVTSELNAGSEFRVSLPVIDYKEEASDETE